MASDRPRMQMTAVEFKGLLEYSASLPTGTTPGKRWKARKGHYVLDRKLSVGGGIDALTHPFVRRWQEEWVVGQYYELTGAEAVKYPGEIGIRWFRPVIVCASGEGVKPKPTKTLKEIGHV